MNVEKKQEENTHEEDMCSIKEIHTDSIKKAKEQLEDEQTYQKLAETFKIFGNTTRLKIMSLLAVEDLCVCDLCEAMNMSQSAISHQLRTLRGQNLVKYKKEGKQARYSLADRHVVEILKIGTEHVLE